MFSLLVLSCGLFSSLPKIYLPAATPTAVMAFPSPSSASTQTEVFALSDTPSETSQSPSGTPVLSPTLSFSPTSSPTTTPFPTILPLTCLPSQSTPEYGQVKRVQDGNTILVDIQGHLNIVRYLGIQSPQNLPNIQYMGPPAATQNAALVLGQIVELLPDGALRDQNGQLLRYVLLYKTQTFVNFEMLRLGLAQTALDSPNLTCYDTFNLVQQQAQVDERGLWAPTPTLFPSATLRPTHTATLTATRAPTGQFSPTPGPGNTATTTSTTPSATPGTLTSTPASATPSPSGASPSATGSPVPTETQALPPGPTSTSQTGVKISSIFYHGTTPNESDEYIEITNFGPSSVNLLNWWISANTELAYFTFGQVTLGVGQSCRVYTNQASGTSWCGDFESPVAVWDNTSDCADLNDPNDNLMAHYCYP
jgi:endonuclease YncB( thermonuclease family)